MCDSSLVPDGTIFLRVGLLVEDQVVEALVLVVIGDVERVVVVVQPCCSDGGAAARPGDASLSSPWVGNPIIILGTTFVLRRHRTAPAFRLATTEPRPGTRNALWFFLIPSAGKPGT